MIVWLLLAVGCACGGQWWWAMAFAVLAVLDGWIESRPAKPGDSNWMDFPC